MRDRTTLSGMELVREIQLTDWSTAGNLSNQSSRVQIPRDICTRFGRYLYSTKCSWIISSYYLQLFIVKGLCYVMLFTGSLFRAECTIGMVWGGCRR